MLSPHPADPTLTTDNLMEVVKEVEHRWKDLGRELDVPESKRGKIIRLYRSDHHRMEAVVDYYIRYCPTPSWKHVTKALQRMDLDEVAAVITTKYAEGTDVNCLILNQAIDGQLLVLDFNIKLIRTILIMTVNVLA